tara:strand:+ start:578 stop:1243 length:666 start_codon:yes stop_codon:yes gene_type:complete
MVEIFPEIETFFQQEQFSQEQLDALKETIEIIYKDEHSRKLAISAINIKLLQYQLSGPVAARVNEKLKRVRIKRRNKKAATSNSKKKLLISKLENKKISKKEIKQLVQKIQDVKGFLTENTLNKPLEVTASYLQMSRDKFIERLNAPKDLVLDKNTLFKEDLLERNIKWIEVRMKSNQRSNRSIKNKKVKKSPPSRKSAPGVYGKLAKTNSIGKLIYTRMS